MQLTTQAFQDQDQIPVKYTMPGAGGENISVPLQWNDLPQGTKSLALICIDPHPVANNWLHWLVINIPPHVASLPEGASGGNMPQGSRELQNSFLQTRLRRPSTPKRHRAASLCIYGLCPGHARAGFGPGRQSAGISAGYRRQGSGSSPDSCSV